MSLRMLAIVAWLMAAGPMAGAVQVAFDVPSTIECRDVTPPEFAAAHPNRKVIEARMRISARLMEGNPDELVDFVYVITSADKTMRLQDYLPNTTLESAVAEDQIEITAANEKAQTTGAEAHVVYKLLAVGASHNQSSKKSESSHYKQIAAKDTVLSSGTTDREHGVFFRMRPSRTASLEGAKEFTFLATVPKSWRGDLCSISCTARGMKKTLISTSVAPAGNEQVLVGMHLAGDAEACSLAEELRQVQESRVALLAAQHAKEKENVFETISNQAVVLITGKKTDAQLRRELAENEKTSAEVKQRLRQMAR